MTAADIEQMEGASQVISEMQAENAALRKERDDLKAQNAHLDQVARQHHDKYLDAGLQRDKLLEQNSQLKEDVEDARRQREALSKLGDATIATLKDELARRVDVLDRIAAQFAHNAAEAEQRAKEAGDELRCKSRAEGRAATWYFCAAALRDEVRSWREGASKGAHVAPDGEELKAFLSRHAEYADAHDAIQAYADETGRRAELNAQVEKFGGSPALFMRWIAAHASADTATNALLVGWCLKAKAVIAKVRFALGSAEWATPEHAEEVLRETIDRHWLNLKVVFDACPAAVDGTESDKPAVRQPDAQPKGGA